MKTAIYLTQDTAQIVLTPEYEFEKSIVNLLNKGQRGCKLHTGSFYECEGGWMRQGNDDFSFIVVIKWDV